ncbi:MAG TPA: hypothetical protein VLB09_09890, partial [Nitrospiria bacterium]|nr:hypothetical protein [Nitrospiria bacterium]
MGISIVHAAQKIQTDQKQLERSLEEARLNLSRFEMEKTGRFQEKLGLGVVRAFHRAPDPGPAFRSALQKEWGRLRKTEERIFFRLNNHLAFLMDRQKTFPQTIPLKFQEAVESAVRSEKMRGNAERAPMARALAELRADLKWQRTPEDYSRLTGGVLERLTGYRVAGGFVEYGLPSLLGIFLAMGWLGASLPKDHPLWRAGGFTEALQPDILYQKMKEVFTMPSNLTIFNWPQQTIFGPRASGEVGRYANGNNLRRAVVITDQGVHAENLSAQLTRSLAEARVQFQINTQARRDVADTVVEDI